MSKILSICLGVILACITFVSNAVDMTNPYILASEVATTTVNELKANKDKLSDKDFARSLVQKELMPYVDIKYAAYKVMGASLNKTTPQEREEFTKAFEEYMVQSLSDVLGKYVNQDIVPEPNKVIPKDASIVSVKFTIKEQGKKDLFMVLKMRLNKKTSEWKVFDLVGENISILDAKESEISPIIKSKGIAAAIETLKNLKIEIK